MRIIFMGSNPWPPRMAQASTCIMVECRPSKRLFFDFGPGCLRNIVANQVPVPEINDIVGYAEARGERMPGTCIVGIGAHGARSSTTVSGTSSPHASGPARMARAKMRVPRTKA